MKFYHVDKSKVRCPRCQAPMKIATSIQGGPSENWLKCTTPNCNTYYDTSIPMPHQAMILKDGSRRLGVFGGYGSGKTYTNSKGDQKHVAITPNGETLIGADTLVQLENTIKKDLERDFPADFVKRYNRQKNMIHFTNGHTIYYRHLADEGDIRSYNLSRAHILEASEVKHESYVQLQSRMRNDAAIRYAHDEEGRPIVDLVEGIPHKREALNWLQMVIESNPDSGWIKEDFLLRSGKILIHNDKMQKYHVNPHEASQSMHTHIIPSKANIHLPKDFIENLRKGKPEWWVKRYLYGNFDYSEGLVYPNAPSQIIKGFMIPDHWPRVIGMDYGLNDNTHFVFGALDLKGEWSRKPSLHLYHEIVINNASITQIAQVYKQDVRRIVPRGKLYKLPVMDGRSYAQRTRTGEKKTIGTLFREEGCSFKAAQMDVEARVMKTNDLIDNGQLYYHENGVPHLIEETKKYKYPERKLESTTNVNKPIDKDNHGINAKEFIVMELPHRLKEINHDVRSASVDGRMNIQRARKEWDPLEDLEPRSQYEGFAQFFD